jgi:1-acyl-sn-glycerol-3-phosphate acyltransferase
VKDVPPLIARRLVVAPVVVVLCVVLTLLSPIWLMAALIVDAVRRHGLGTTRLVAFGVVHVVSEAAMIVALFLLWIASLFGLLLRSAAIQSAHYALLRGWLRCLSAAAISLLGLRIEVVDPPEPRPGPLLVFGRHAGAGNSLMMIRTLMLRYRRRPRVVMLAFLQWDPVIDVVCHRLPSLFIEHDPARSDHFVERIGRLASGMGDADALVLYPEGHDFTEQLRERAIRHLRRLGHDRAAERAEAMEYVLPPRHKGPLAAILAAPDADVVLVAHTALEALGSFRELPERVPLERPILARYWRVPAAEVPHDQETLIEWLYDWWQRIDDWVEEHAPVTASA